MSQESVKAALLKTIEGVQKNPQMSNVVFRSETVWEGDVRCSAKIRDFQPMTIDEPPELGGQNDGPNPVELVLAALGTCQEIMYSAYASVMDIELESVSVNARGFLDLKGLFGLDPNVPAGYQRISFETKISSPASNEELLELIETVEKHCPVMDILSRPMTITGNTIANGQPLHKLDTQAA